MNTSSALRAILAEAMGIDTSGFEANTLLLGAVPELDSMSVMEVVMALEQRFEIDLADEELDASVFASFGSLELHLRRRLAMGRTAAPA
ncbi:MULTISPECIES: acyl carrier protein [unclassified Roseateles]|uniref:acyl carrier protein n=1 Tax=unclassified Roseateles TaxID=2626991 RepID=UPI0022B8CBBC|nr:MULTISPECIES: phosphopantetheine-binding protein [unclassified Roseateles]MCZ7881626.1 phosphopantetheine-binding protein [Paucibacter sp. M5-1]MDC6170274.1 phosphopantetheine-binding protein [Paucibacter sp. XJ19-41]